MDYVPSKNGELGTEVSAPNLNRASVVNSLHASALFRFRQSFPCAEIDDRNPHRPRRRRRPRQSRSCRLRHGHSRLAGKKIAELSQYLGHHTNNYAEYNGLLAALRYAIAHRIHSLKIISDSELMVRQMKGIYKVRHPELRKLYDEAQRLTAQIEHVEIRHALREHNQDADRLANEAMDRGKNSPRGEAEPEKS